MGIEKIDLLGGKKRKPEREKEGLGWECGERERRSRGCRAGREEKGETTDSGEKAENSIFFPTGGFHAGDDPRTLGLDPGLAWTGGVETWTEGSDYAVGRDEVIHTRCSVGARVSTVRSYHGMYSRYWGYGTKIRGGYPKVRESGCPHHFLFGVNALPMRWILPNLRRQVPEIS